MENHHESTLPRFYAPDLLSGESIELEASEANHAASVLRLKVGESVIAFDGRGHEALMELSEVQKRRVVLRRMRLIEVGRELKRPIHAYIALPKGDRQKTLIEGLVQLGVISLTPLVTARAVAEAKESVRTRLERAVLEASKQCRRNQLMEIRPPATVAELCVCPGDYVGNSLGDDLRLFAHPYGASRRLLSWNDIAIRSQSLSIAIGPEGGFTDGEVSLLLAGGWDQTSLGPRILRVEMAAIAVAAWWEVFDQASV